MKPKNKIMKIKVLETEPTKHEHYFQNENDSDKSHDVIASPKTNKNKQIFSGLVISQN